MDHQAALTAPDEHEKRVRRPPVYELGPGGHYNACQELVRASRGADPEAYNGIWSNITSGLEGNYRNVLATYWMASLRQIEDAEHNYKEHQLPLARIKKVMKADPEVKMISAEAPILFAKGADLFITEVTMRAWFHAEENKRRTLQRSDLAAAVSKLDMFDFLIDLIPREEATQSSSKKARSGSNAPAPPQPAVQSEYNQFVDHDYRQQGLYQDSGYHAQTAMGFDPSQSMYPGYGVQQVYQGGEAQGQYRQGEGEDVEGEGV